MSNTRIKRGSSPPRRPARTPKKRRKVQTSRLNAIINALPISPQRLQKVANWTIGLGLFAVAGLAAHATGVTAKIHEEYAQAVGRAGFQVKKVEVVGAEGPVTFMKARSGTWATLAGDRHCLVNGPAETAAIAWLWIPRSAVFIELSLRHEPRTTG